MSRDYQYNETKGPVEIGDVQSAIAAGAALGEPRTVPTELPGAGVFTVVPKDYAVKDLESFLPRPRRIQQQVWLYDTDSFISYVKEFMSGSTLIFFDAQQEEFNAAFDYHEIDKPSWCEHQATYKPRRSVEFETWMGVNRKQLTQVEFARFLEENLPDIAEPKSAELLEAALRFEAKKNVTFSSGMRLDNGQIQFQYDEDVRNTPQKGTIELPAQIVLGISVHMNGPAYRISVRLRWRLQDSKLCFWFEIVRPHKFVEDALSEIRQRIEKETAIPLLVGSTEKE